MTSLYQALIYVIIFMNLLGFLLMYIDKERAIKHKWRISENTLLLVGLLFGSFGTFLGMQLFRHKTKHLKFRVLVPLFAVLQILIINYGYKALL